MKMKLIATATAILVLTASFHAVLVQAKPGNRIKPGVDFNGPHFNLNIHGVPDGVDKFKNDSIGPGRHSIFVPLNTTDDQGNPFNITIQYAFSYDLNWTVLDCDATGEGHNASIVLPAYMYIDTNADGAEEKKRVSYYMVYVVGLGKPKDDSLAILYPEIAHNGSWTAYSLYENKLEVPGHRKGGKGKTGEPVWCNATDLFFVDVTFWNGTDYIYYEYDWVFDVPGLEGYWWKVTNNEVRLMQVRFYPVFKGNGK